MVGNLSGRPLVLGVSGSPRVSSNTHLLLERVVAGAALAGAETKVVRLRDLKYSSCRHCGGCDGTGECVVQDDMQEVYRKLREARHLVLASPIHFSAVSGEMKAMIDRAQCCWIGKYRLKQPVSQVSGERRGVFAASCGGKDTRVFEWAKHTVKAFLNSTGFRYWGEFFEANADGSPPVPEREERLTEAEELGRRLVAG
ncbi:MAG: flavodoxin family protein [Armatimonadota bacterium]|nr:MAG: flavodoxin family protein [Armatimonadota bacterium]